MQWTYQTGVAKRSFQVYPGIIVQFRACLRAENDWEWLLAKWCGPTDGLMTAISMPELTQLCQVLVAFSWLLMVRTTWKFLVAATGGFKDSGLQHHHRARVFSKISGKAFVQNDVAGCYARSGYVDLRCTCAVCSEWRKKTFNINWTTNKFLLKLASSAYFMGLLWLFNFFIRFHQYVPHTSAWSHTSPIPDGPRLVANAPAKHGQTHGHRTESFRPKPMVRVGEQGRLVSLQGVQACKDVAALIAQVRV